MEKSLLSQDRTFKRIVIVSSGIGLSCMLGSAAALRISKEAGLQFRWHWSILVIAAAAVFLNWRMWRLVWKSEEGADEKNRRKLLFYLGTLLLLGIGSFLYPILFVEHSYWVGIAKGLFTAGAFLGTMFWLIYSCGKGFNQIDEIELERQSQNR
jgi:hypothetical protein